MTIGFRVRYFATEGMLPGLWFRQLQRLPEDTEDKECFQKTLWILFFYGRLSEISSVASESSPGSHCECSKGMHLGVTEEIDPKVLFNDTSI